MLITGWYSYRPSFIFSDIRYTDLLVKIVLKIIDPQHHNMHKEIIINFVCFVFSVGKKRASHP